VLLNVVSWYVGNFVVKPNELDRETPYIAHNIEMTRKAFGLDRFAQREFPAETNVEAADPANNQVTLKNIRLWDWRALQDTLRQVQEIRTYYDFPDIDIDRYVINGEMRQVMLATRELNVEKLPESSRNWINERLIYFESAAWTSAVLGGGRIIKTIGDEVFFAAPTAEAACRIGLEICRAVGRDEVLPPARGAVGIGPAIPREGDYFGPLVNLLARLVKVGAPGEVVVTEALARQLPPEIWDLRPLLPAELRGIVEPVSASIVERRVPT
jgi:hypothetical protein